MNDQFSAVDLERLAQHSDDYSISLYMPMEQAGRETEQNKIRLKNVLSAAESKLVETGMRAPEAQELLAPAADLVDQYQFWQYQSTGLAMFFSEDSFYRYRLPVQFGDISIIGRQFHLKPLMPLFHGDGPFYILALAQGENRLYRATRHTIERLEADQVPKDLAEALWYDDMEPTLQYHTTETQSGPEGGAIPAVSHGHGRGKEPDKKDDILRYFRKIDKGITDLLEVEETPLVLMGVDYLLPIYREANSYNNLFEEGVTGSPKVMDDQEIHAATWDIVADHFDQPRLDAIETYNDLIDSDRTSTDLKEIVPAAYFGQVESLFVALDQHRWGTFDAEENELSFAESSQLDNHDLLDRAAVQTFLNSGEIFALSSDQVSEQIPGGQEIAAVYRW